VTFILLRLVALVYCMIKYEPSKNFIALWCFLHVFPLPPSIIDSGNVYQHSERSYRKKEPLSSVP